jgi:hypothetical protein
MVMRELLPSDYGDTWIMRLLDLPPLHTNECDRRVEEDEQGARSGNLCASVVGISPQALCKYSAIRRMARFLLTTLRSRRRSQLRDPYSAMEFSSSAPDAVSNSALCASFIRAHMSSVGIAALRSGRCQRRGGSQRSTRRC